jgi:high-affinity K+ transport system ATPase subunit B
MKIVDMVKKEIRFNRNNKKQKVTKTASSNTSNKKKSTIDARVVQDSITKLNPRYLAKNNAVMFTVEVGFIVVFIIALFPSISTEFVLSTLK